MRQFAFVLLFSLFLLSGVVLSAQTHVSVPVGHSVYFLLAQAEARGLCSPLPAIRPLTRARIVEAINEILAAEPKRFIGLSDAERKIYEDARLEFKRGEPGLDLWKGMYRFHNPGKNGIQFTGDFGVAVESTNSVARYREEDENYIGTDTWGTFFFKGDVGGNFSFDVDFSVGLMRAQRSYLGEYDTYATELEESGENKNEQIQIYSQPKAFFPYTYQKGWDGFTFGPGDISASGMESWPEEIAISPRMLAEMSGTVFGDMLLLRAGRFQREWGGMTPGSSLVFNAAARPFLAMEMIFNPVSWFSYSALTGVLEFDNAGGIRESAYTFQNAFSIQQIELNYRNYFHIDFGSTAIWPKRFELGYIFPLLDNFFYQNFIGDMDNMAVFFNIKGRYPGLGGIWFSFFLDEAEISSMMKDAFTRDRHMFAYQFGLQGMIPGVPFGSLTVSYTKVEPYTYTHTRNYAPWYDRANGAMEKAYVNNGVGLGYYLPPNSDEIKVRFDVRPWVRTGGHWQYQLIRHGADYGPHQVDGSSLLSELDPVGRSDKPSLRKNFLKDGAYQWMHIIKIGMEHKFGSLPLTIFGEAGLVYSYFTDISNEEYEKYHPTDKIDPKREPIPWAPPSGDYLNSTSYILTIGFRIFK